MPRAYNLGARAVAAAETHRRIVAAARVLFARKGYRNVTFDAIAAAARVSRAAAFKHFASKAELLRAVEVDAAARAGVPAMIEQILAAAPVDALRIAVASGTRVWAAEHAVFREFYGNAPFDEQLRPLVEDKEALRRQVIAGMVSGLAGAGKLRAGWTEVRATDALWLITSFAAFHQIHQQCPADQVAAILLALAAAVVDLDPAAEDRTDVRGPARTTRRKSGVSPGRHS